MLEEIKLSSLASVTVLPTAPAGVHVLVSFLAHLHCALAHMCLVVTRVVVFVVRLHRGALRAFSLQVSVIYRAGRNRNEGLRDEWLGSSSSTYICFRCLLALGAGFGYIDKGSDYFYCLFIVVGLFCDCVKVK